MNGRGPTHAVRLRAINKANEYRTIRYFVTAGSLSVLPSSRLTVRMSSTFRWAGELRRDLRYALRSLVRTPAFTSVALLTLGLGIGANTAIFSVTNAVLFRALPFTEPDRLVFLWSTSRDEAIPLVPGRLVDFRERLTTIEQVAGISHLSVNLTGGGHPERLSASSVSSSFFDVLGVPPLLGDSFHTNRADPHEVVLSHGLWVRRFASDPAIVGRTMTLNGRSRRVSAVMPHEFAWPLITGRGSSNGNPPELWIPAAQHDIPRTPSDDPAQNLSGDRSTGFLRAVARLRHGTTLAQAQSEIETLTKQLAREHPEDDRNVGGKVQQLREQLFGAVRQPLLLLMGAVGFVLAIACANAASLLLGRANARRREIATRLALGASPATIIRQVLTESTVLALGGAIVGLFVAWWARVALVSLAPPNVPRLGDAGIDLPVLGFALLASAATGVLFGIVPAWQLSRASLVADIHEGGARGSGGTRAKRARDMLVIAQIAVAFVLLIGAGLLLRSFQSLTDIDTGIETRNLLTFEMSLSGTRGESPQSRAAFFDDVLTSIRALPGVRSAAAAVTLPIGGDDFNLDYVTEARPIPPDGQPSSAGFQVVSPRYFETMGIPLAAGRDFRASDSAEAPRVVLVNEMLANREWPGQDPVGKRVRLGRDPSNQWMTVVGLVRNIRHHGPSALPRPELYRPLAQSPFSFSAFVVRTETDPRPLVSAVRGVIAKLDPAQPIFRVATMEDHLERALSRSHFMSTLTSAFGLLALTLAVVGIYGVMAYSVSQRTREIAIRAALGASRSDVLTLVLRKVFGLAGAGITAGLAGAWMLTRVLAGELHGVSLADPITYIFVLALLIVVALLAALIPAARAARVDAAGALRN